MLEIGLVSACFRGGMKNLKNGLLFFDVQQKFILLNPLKQNNVLLSAEPLTRPPPVLGRLWVCSGQGQGTRVLSGAGLIPAGRVRSGPG